MQGRRTRPLLVATLAWLALAAAASAEEQTRAVRAEACEGLKPLPSAVLGAAWDADRTLAVLEAALEAVLAFAVYGDHRRRRRRPRPRRPAVQV